MEPNIYINYTIYYVKLNTLWRWINWKYRSKFRAINKQEYVKIRVKNAKQIFRINIKNFRNLKFWNIFYQLKNYFSITNKKWDDKKKRWEKKWRFYKNFTKN